jgi:hypothetical protein
VTLSLFNFRERTLELARMVWAAEISDYQIELNGTFEWDHMVRKGVLHLVAEVTSENLGEVERECWGIIRVRHSEPLTWWDKYKHDHPWVDRWCYDFIEPPKFKHTYVNYHQKFTFRFTGQMLFPDYKIPKGQAFRRSRWLIREEL